MFARTRFSRRSLSGLADKWSQAHAGDKLERRRWPRPGSPLASYIKHDIYSDEEEAAMVEAASRSRLPPLTDEAESFEAYVEHVQTNNLARQTSSTAAQIKNEAQHYRLTRRRSSMPQASAFIDEPSWEDVGDGNGEEDGRQQQLQHQHQQRTRNDGLPAGRFSDLPRQSASGAAAAAAEEPDKAAGGLRASIARFSLTPRAVKAHLDEYVIGQDQAKRALSVAVCDHYNFARTCLASPDLAPSHHVKPNILLLGPSGSGKTHLMRALSKLLCVPFVKADATKFSATGYVGGDVDDVVRSLLPAAGGDVEMAEFGIVYIDEVDKLAESAARRGGGLFGGGGGSGINTRDVQHALLKLMEDAEVPLQPPNASAPSPPPHLQRGGASLLPAPRVRGAAATREAPRSVLRTRHVLFVFSGAFTGLEASLRSQQQQQQQEEAATAHAAAETAKAQQVSAAESRDVLQLARTADLVGAGLEPEFVGRVPVRVACRHLSVEDLVSILREAKDSVAGQLARDFRGYGIELRLSECALREVAERAVREQTGARGLLTVLEDALRDFKFECPGTGVTAIDVDAEVVRRPAESLTALLARHREQQQPPDK